MLSFKYVDLGGDDADTRIVLSRYRGQLPLDEAR